MNKNDKEQKLESEILKNYIQQIVYLSAKDSCGIDKLQKAVETELGLNELDFDTVTAANERQKRCIDSALDCVKNAVEAIESGVLLDGATILIDEAEKYLLELTGQRITDAVVDEVFSRFCVGK